MKLEDLAEKSREEQSQLIEKQPKVVARDMLDNPEKMQGKILVFPGNHRRYNTDGLCVRRMQYFKNEHTWVVSDIDLSDMFCETYGYHFPLDELLQMFNSLCNGEAFLLEE